MAATFFILGGKVRDAIEVCLHQMGDIQLAIVLHRTLGEDIDIGVVLEEPLKPYEHLSAAHFLRHWVSGNLRGAVRSLLTVRHPWERSWLVHALIHTVDVASSPGCSGEDEPCLDPREDLFETCALCADLMTRNGMPLLALETELIASKCVADTQKGYSRWKNEASIACALTLVEAPVSLIPDMFAEDDFNQRIAELITRIEELQGLGIDVSTNVVLHGVESVYKSLSYCETVLSPVTPKSSAEGSLGLGRTRSMDTQSRTSGFSSYQRTSLDEQQQLARMISRSKISTGARDAVSTQIVYPKGVEIFRVDADVLYSVCSCPLLAPDVCVRLVAVATPKNGILEFATHPDVLIGPHVDLDHDQRIANSRDPFQEARGYDSPKHDSGVFSKLVSQIFDQTTWMTDPLENQSVMIDGDVGLAVHSTIRSEGQRQPAPLADAKTTVSKMLVAHPHRQLFLSGCKDTARIKLWQYDGPRPLQLFTPVPHHDLQQLAAMNHDMFSMSSNFAKSQSLASKMSHWGRAVDMCFSENGERFASIGEGGVVAVWSLNSSFSKYVDVDGATCSEWWHTCLKTQGRSVAFVGGSSVVVAASGLCESGNVSLWNTSLPEREACVGRLRHHKSPVNKVKTLPGGWLLASADDAGTLSVSDVRMLGSPDKDPVLWTAKACKGRIRAIDTIAYESSAMQPRSSFKRHHFPAGLGMDTAIVTGGDDGIVRIWDVNSGSLLQQSERIYSSTPKANRILSLASGDAKYSITDLTVCEEGILSAGTDGVVRLFPRLF
jgi:hypothetical protein